MALENYYKEWTEEEKQFVKDNFGTMSVRQIAETLGRSRNGVAGVVQRLGISGRTKSWNAWTNGQKKFLAENWNIYRTWYLAKILGKTPSAVKEQMKRMGIRIRDGQRDL